MRNSHQAPKRKRVGLLLVGGPHHILHLVPIAAALETYSHIDIEVFVATDSDALACQSVLTALGATRTQIRVLKTNALAKRISPKLGFLLSHLKIWKNLDALIVAERTSTILRYFTKALPPFIHIPHGAGDRAKSYDRRIRHFDHVLVAGEKDKKRMVALGLVTQNIHIDLGSPKSSDMSYTRAANIYLGDVSSQVYEFLTHPKPCIFITQPETQWQGNPDYAHWSYGPVCHSVSNVMEALNQAMPSITDYAQAQTEGCLAAKGDPAWNPIRRAADAVKTILDEA